MNQPKKTSIGVRVTEEVSNCGVFAAFENHRRWRKP